MVKSFDPAPPWCPKQQQSAAPWSRSLVHCHSPRHRCLKVMIQLPIDWMGWDGDATID